MLHTTFRRAAEAGACTVSYRRMAKALGGVRSYGKDTPIPLDKVLEVCGLKDALWTLWIVIEPADKGIRLFACDCAERVLPLFESQFPNDKRPRQAINTARLYANRQATETQLIVARAAARASAGAAMASFWAARSFAGAAAETTAEAAAWAAEAAWAVEVGGSLEAAVKAAAEAAAWAAEAAWAVEVGGSLEAAIKAAGAAEVRWQKERFLELLEGEDGQRQA